MASTAASGTAGAVVLRHAAIQATYAPSVYNTQPWILRLTPDDLAVHADPGRWLMSLDRMGRQLLISCGCALFNVRTSVAADGWQADIRRTPANLPDETLIATATVSSTGTGVADPVLAELNPWVQAGPDDSVRRSPADPMYLSERLRAAAVASGAELIPATGPTSRTALQQAIDHAEQVYRPDQDARTARWSSAGVLGSSEWSNSPVQSEAYLLTSVLVTPGDAAEDWITAGEAMQRMLLELARSGYAADLCLPAIEVAAVRARIQDIIGSAASPQAVLQIGPADQASPTPQRRLLLDVIRESAD
ncbi:hypothetical protein [Microlunatus sp. Gsoil 973]|uniref:hypothetical protein n=1 Tax=Microlunatus sp. Gsoil 973 TaxID=2672569 RepID=UPI0012B467AE|nr:hypothetical protein [Microlunatus sp. Gsoil 973]QGN34297.1 hypothetical protein GJV80_17375 [Microlunatus sp. Gsoil 973]